MQAVAKRVNKRDTNPEEEVKKPSNRSGVPLNLNIRKGLRDRLYAFVENQRPRASITANVEAAIEDYLDHVGAPPEHGTE